MTIKFIGNELQIFDSGVYVDSFTTGYGESRRALMERVYVSLTNDFKVSPEACESLYESLSLIESIHGSDNNII